VLQMRSRTKWSLGLLAATIVVVLTGSAAQAISGGTPAEDGTYRYLAKIDIGGARSCTGALIAPQWVVTARTCFAEGGVMPVAGPPAKPSTATVGRTPLSSTDGYVLPIVELNPRTDRNVVLAKLATPIPTIAPVPIATTAPTTGETLRIGGYGRTATEWVPDRLHTANFTVGSVAATGLDITAAAGDSDPCKGDAGGPALREVNGNATLVAINSTSWQHGCLAETESRHGASETRLDDIATWLRDNTKTGAFTDGQEQWRNSLWFDNAKHVSGDWNGDGKEDLAILYKWDAGHSVIHTWTSTGTGLEFHYALWDSGAGQFVWDNAQFVAGDWNGDGKDDLAILYKWDAGHSVIHTWTSTGTGLTFHYALWDSGVGQFTYDNAKFVAGDWNGDGKDDLAILYKWDPGHTVIHTWTSTGTGLTFHFAAWDSGNGGFAWDNTKFVAGDWNGDGKDDVAALTKSDATHSQLYTWTSNGTAFQRSNIVSITTVPWDSARFVAGDWNGDGKKDLAIQSPRSDGRGVISTWTSNGTGFTANGQVLWLSAPLQPVAWDSAKAIPVPAALNGGAKDDLAFFYNNGNDNASIYRFTSVTVGATTG
jgi:hypothetical protein